MTVELIEIRKTAEISWDKDVVTGAVVDIVATNPDTGDVSSRETPNDGKATLTYPHDYHGASEIVVTGSDGGVDTGVITV